MSLLDLEMGNEIPDDSDDSSKWPTGFCTQYTQLTIRTFRESRKRILDKWKFLDNLLICAFVCLIFFRLPRNEETLRDRMGAIFFISAHWGFIPLFDAVSSCKYRYFVSLSWPMANTCVQLLTLMWWNKGLLT